MRAHVGLWSSILALGCALVGCSSSSGSESSPVPVNNPSTGQVHAQVLAACQAFAARVCSGAQSCCQQAYGGYDAEACADAYDVSVCQPAADAVAAGFASFDESAVEGCISALNQQNALCFPTWQEVVELRKVVYAACKSVRGTALEGQGCSSSVTCAQPDGARSAVCSRSKCKVLEVLAEGAACELQSGDVSVCDTGTYCTATLDGPGVCAPVTPLGSTCRNMLENPECGLGNYCDPADLTCKQTVNTGGPSCQQGLECMSFQCDRVLGECAPQLATVSQATCLGAM